MLRSKVIAGAAICCATSVMAASSFTLKPGNWKFTRTIIPHIYAGKPLSGPPHTDSSTSCDRDGQGLLDPRHSYCRFTVKDFSGGRVNAVEECRKGPATTTYTYRGRVAKDSFDINELMTGIDDKGVVQFRIETRISARWVGVCRR